MKFKVKKLICSENKEKAVKGKEYYFFNDVADIIEAFRKGTADQYKGTLVCSTDVYDTDLNAFYKLEEPTETSRFKFIYPASNKEPEETIYPISDKELEGEVNDDRYLTYEEMKAMWLNNPSRLYKCCGNTFVITGCNDINKDFTSSYCKIVFNIPTIIFSENVNIRDITDMNDKPLTISEYSEYNLQCF